MTVKGGKTGKSAKLTFADIKRLAGEHLKTAVNVESFSITFAKLEENDWRVNVEYREKGAPMNWRGSALFKINGITGEVKEFQKGRFWTF